MFRVTKFVSAAVVLLTLSATALPQTRTYPRDEQNVRQLLTRIQNRTNNLRQNLFRISDYRQRQELQRLTQDFDNSVSRLNVNRRWTNTSDVQAVLDRATRIDNVLYQYQPNRAVANIWDNLRLDISALANAYGLTWSSGTYYPPVGSPDQTSYGQLTGTYRLDPSRSDDPAVIADRATAGLSSWQRQRIRNQLLSRFESPDQIAIDRRGRTITIASSRAPQITFDADGSERIETGPSGRTIRARAMLSGDQLTVTTTGDRDTEFNVTFTPIDNGRRLNVVRRVNIPELNREIIVRSAYEKVSQVARFDIFNGSTTSPSPSNSDFIVRDGETVVAELNDNLSTSTVREGDRFTATVREPSQLAGAYLEGRVTSVERSGRLTGRSQISLDFDTVRTRDGRSYRFAGILDSVRTPDGDVVRVDNEGAVRDSSQTTRTAQRAAIGTAVGAIIGAIAGGGKGAAIGAIIGAGTGAGSVYVQGRDDLELQRGTELVIRASGPR